MAKTKERVVYIVKSTADPEYTGVFTTINKAIADLKETLADDFIFLSEEDEKEIKDRAEQGYVYAYTNDDTEWIIVTAVLK